MGSHLLRHAAVTSLLSQRIPRAPSALEERLWYLMRVEKIPLPEREHKFHPVRKWRFDFAFIGERLAVECEGAVWVMGRHNRGSGFAEDCVKYNEAVIHGWRVLRFTGDMINSGEAIVAIRAALASLSTTHKIGAGAPLTLADQESGDATPPITACPVCVCNGSTCPEALQFGRDGVVSCRYHGEMRVSDIPALAECGSLSLSDCQLPQGTRSAADSEGKS